MTLSNANVARMRELAGKPELSPQELAEFLHLVSDTTGRTELYLPNTAKPVVILWFDESKREYVDIIIVDGLHRDTGECIASEEKNGELVWRIGVLHSYYSQLLGRTVLLNNGACEPIFSEDPLTPRECAKVAKFIYGAIAKT